MQSSNIEQVLHNKDYIYVYVADADIVKENIRNPFTTEAITVRPLLEFNKSTT